MSAVLRGKSCLLGNTNLGSVVQKEFPIGKTNVTYMFTDDAKNFALCQFTVSIMGKSTRAL